MENLIKSQCVGGSGTKSRRSHTVATGYPRTNNYSNRSVLQTDRFENMRMQSNHSKLHIGREPMKISDIIN